MAAPVIPPARIQIHAAGCTVAQAGSPPDRRAQSAADCTTTATASAKVETCRMGIGSQPRPEIRMNVAWHSAAQQREADSHTGRPRRLPRPTSGARTTSDQADARERAARRAAAGRAARRRAARPRGSRSPGSVEADQRDGDRRAQEGREHGDVEHRASERATTISARCAGRARRTRMSGQRGCRVPPTRDQDDDQRQEQRAPMRARARRRRAEHRLPVAAACRAM